MGDFRNIFAVKIQGQGHGNQPVIPAQQVECAVVPALAKGGRQGGAGDGIVPAQPRAEVPDVLSGDENVHVSPSKNAILRPVYWAEARAISRPSR